MTLVEASAGYNERATCSLCGKRRMCRFFAVLGIPGVAWLVCREHVGWEPVEGRDFTVEAQGG